MRQSVLLAQFGTEIVIDSWTKIEEIEGLLFVTVTFTSSEKLSNEVKLSMFSEITDKENKSSSSNKANNLSLFISKQVCQRLNGDLKLEKNKTGKQVFIFFVRCINARKVFDPESFPSSSNKNSDET